jgi:hypothetical protein
MIELIDLTQVIIYFLCLAFWTMESWKRNKEIKALQKSSEQSERIKELENHIDFLRFSSESSIEISIMIAKHLGMDIKRGEENVSEKM